jgi:hypothetical protein
MRLYKVIVSLLLVLLINPGCAPFKSVVRGVNDVAQTLCELFYREHPEKLPAGVNVAEAARVICQTQDVLDPFIEHVTSVSRVGVSVTAAPSASASCASSAASAAPPSLSAPLAPSASAAP